MAAFSIYTGVVSMSASKNVPVDCGAGGDPGTGCKQKRRGRRGALREFASSEALLVSGSRRDPRPGRKQPAVPGLVDSREARRMKMRYLKFRTARMRYFVGRLSLQSRIFVWGKHGRGKSTFCLRLVSEWPGRKLWIAAEEETAMVGERIRNRRLRVARMDILSTTSLERVIGALETGKYAVCVIDSVRYLRDSGRMVTEEQYIELARMWPRVSWIWLQHAAKDGTHLGRSDLAYDSTANFFVEEDTTVGGRKSKVAVKKQSVVTMEKNKSAEAPKSEFLAELLKQ